MVDLWSPTDRDRFWSKVDGQSPWAGCWTWTGCTNPAGYGVFNLRGKAELAHRVSWRLMRGANPAPWCVLHRCDNPRCINPAHLFLGTQAQNVQDMDAKQRRVSKPLRGEQHANAKLTDAIVREIRTLRRERWAQTDIATHFGVTQCTVSSVLRGATWKHVQ